MEGNYGTTWWGAMEQRNDFSTSPVAVQDLPHDYSRSPLAQLPVIDDSAFIAYLWAIIIHVISSASMTFAGAAAGGPGADSTPIVTIGLLMQIGHAVIGLMKGQGEHMTVGLQGTICIARCQGTLLRRHLYVCQ